MIRRIRIPRPGVAAAWLFAASTALALAGCGSGQPSAASQPAVAIVKGDTCAVCGMYIMGYPGPRGEAYVAGRSKPLKFGSTRDFFAFVLQPDEKNRLQTLYVQDSARIDWQHPSNAPSSFIAARHAYYVAWQPLLGAMGPTLASFARKDAAEAFVRRHGGSLLRYGQITPELISTLKRDCPPAGSALAALAPHCRPSHQRQRAAAPVAGHTRLAECRLLRKHVNDPLAADTWLQ